MALNGVFNVREGNYVGIMRYVDIYTMRTSHIDYDANAGWMIDGDGPNGVFNWRQGSDGGELKCVLLTEDICDLPALLAAAEAEVTRTDIILRRADHIASIRSRDPMDDPDAYEAAVTVADKAWVENNEARLYLKFLRIAQRGVKGEW